MEITYTFADGTTSKVEVTEEIGTFIIDSRRSEASADRKERNHSWSLDAIVYEGSEYGRRDQYPSDDDTAERAIRVREAFSHLSEIQQRRLCLYANGKTLREIAALEEASFQSVAESINAAKKKFIKFF